MKIVIDIPEDVYKRTVFYREFKDLNDCVATIKALEKGTPLPKGHGNLIQREDAETIFKNARKALLEQSRKEQIEDLQTREMMLLNAEQFIHLIHPIIEAESEDKGVLDQINEKQDSLIATCQAWDKAIEKDGYVN